MSRTHIDHRDLMQFAEDKVNLPKDKADEYRAQARRLREKLEGYISEHPDFSLKRIQLSGSLAKGTGLRSLNDIDMAVYISGSDAPHDTRALLDYLAERLRKAFPNFSPDQVKPQTYSVTVSFRGTGLDVDVVMDRFSTAGGKVIPTRAVLELAAIHLRFHAVEMVDVRLRTSRPALCRPRR